MELNTNSYMRYKAAMEKIKAIVKGELLWKTMKVCIREVGVDGDLFSGDVDEVCFDSQATVQHVNNIDGTMYFIMNQSPSGKHYEVRNPAHLAIVGVVKG